jgi:hydroxymethylpyrimidine pyrophosphatase-like HAD family hydrolase
MNITDANEKRILTIAIDFDGTIVEHQYPAIGEEMMFAFDTLKALQNQGHRLILWTFRSGKELDEAVEYCRKHGVEFFAVNKNYPEEKFDEATISRKIIADVYVDDRNVGGFLGWSKIWEELGPGNEMLDKKYPHEIEKERTLFDKLKELFK